MDNGLTAASELNLYGRWGGDRTVHTINSGALVEFAYAGRNCTLVFDVEGFTQHPAILVQVDGV